MKSGNLNFLESSGPFQASNGTALTLPIIIHHDLGLDSLVSANFISVTPRPKENIVHRLFWHATAETTLAPILYNQTLRVQTVK